jgi:hypothetical protein
MAKKVQEFASAQNKTGEISGLVIQLENICVQACNELKEEFNRIKKTQA